MRWNSERALAAQAPTVIEEFVHAFPVVAHQNVRLGLEVVEERTLGQVRSIRDRLYRDLVEAVLGEQFHGGCVKASFAIPLLSLAA